MIFTHNCTLEKTNKERKSEDYGGEKNEMKYSLYCIEGRVVGFPSPFYVMRSFITICSLLILPIDDRINPRPKYRMARKKCQTPRSWTQQRIQLYGNVKYL